jgi:urea transporter
MSPEQVLARLRQFLLIIAAVVFLTTIAELIFIGHWTVPIQFLPFVLNGWGLLALGLAFFRPSGTTIYYQVPALVDDPHRPVQPDRTLRAHGQQSRL